MESRLKRLGPGDYTRTTPGTFAQLPVMDVRANRDQNLMASYCLHLSRDVASLQALVIQERILIITGEDTCQVPPAWLTS